MNDLADDAVEYVYILVSASIIANVTAITQVKNTVMFCFKLGKISGIMNDDQKLLELELSLSYYLSLPSRENDESVG